MPTPSFEKINLPDEINEHFYLYFFPDITSQHQDYRLLLRKTLSSILEKNGTSLIDTDKIQDLTNRPEIKPGSISLSHSPEGSVIFYTHKPSVVLGVDLEISERISSSVVKRVSTDFELQSAPNKFDLFTSKEACWKASNQVFSVPTISHIETYDWQLGSVPYWTYSSRLNEQNINGTGYTRNFKQFFLSFFILDLTFVEKHRQR